MRTIIKYSKTRTYKTADGKEFPSSTIYLELDNGRRIGIKCIHPDDNKILRAISFIER